MTQVGGCHCGNIRYEVAGDPKIKGVCHCLTCRKISGSTYTTNALFSTDGFKVTKGTPKEYKMRADSGNPITSYFCGDCGCTLWSDGPTWPDTKTVKLGTLDDFNAMSNLKPDVELFTSKRVEWVGAIPETKQNEHME